MGNDTDRLTADISLGPKQITSVFSSNFVALYLTPRIKLGNAMDSVQLQEILAELIGARIALTSWLHR